VKPDISSVQTKPSQKRSLMRFVRYYTKKRRGDRVLNRVFIAVTAVVVAAAIVSVSFGSGFMAQQEELMNAISGRSIFVVNNTMDHKNLLSQYDYEEALAISPEVIEQIEAISGVNVVYPWYTFLSYGLSPDDTRQANIKIWDGSTLIADKSYVNAPSYSATGDQFTINPLYDEEDFSFVLDYKTDNNIRDGIVLTMALANKLSANPSELIDKQIEIQCFVPTKLFGFDMTVVSNDDEKQVAVEHAYHKLVTIEGTITGILSSSYTLLKTRELNVALLNYDQFIDIITQNKDLNIGEAYPGFPEQALGPSALVVFTNSYENVPIVAAELKSMASAFSVANNSSDVETIKNSLSTTRSILIVVTGVFIGIIAILFGMMYYMKNRSRKKEVGILKAIGFTKLNIATLSMAEMLRLALSAFLFAVILSAILTIVGNKISNQAVFSITSFSILVGFIICVGLVVISGIVPMYNASRVDPIDAIRKTDK
ncbi:MAG: ABC transporter permease, partial [Dehalococcoidia bacterium]|nr:ABC transporter permease [Dehalococcoidia bacterium]